MGDNTRTIQVPEKYSAYTDDQILTFLTRGHYDVTYRHARNKRLAADRKLIKRLRDEGKIPK